VDSGGSSESKIVVNHCARSDWNPSRVGQIEFLENNFVVPDLAKEILEYLNGQLFAGTAAVAEAKGREAGIVADRHRLAIRHTEYRAEATVGEADLSTILDLKGRLIEWTLGKADLPGSLFVNLGACRYAEVTRRIELVRIRPMYWAEAGTGVRRADVVTACKGQAQLRVG